MTIKEYQNYCFNNYKNTIGYDSKYKYLFGNPINVLVPIEIVENKFMIVGAYPSAKFYCYKNVLDTPLYDNDSPFSNESYYDGTRVRSIPSGKELNDVILSKLGIERNECWITDLVKVFLFKNGHINRYKKLGNNEFEENRTKYDEYAKESLPFLHKEIELANPKLILLLGLEVIKNVLEISENKSKELMNGEIQIKLIENVKREFICIPHPGILMKIHENNPWPNEFENKIVPKVKPEIIRIKNTF